MNKYNVFSECDLYDLLNEIDHQLLLGWVCQGGIFIRDVQFEGKTETHFYQAMVREETEEPIEYTSVFKLKDHLINLKNVAGFSLGNFDDGRCEVLIHYPSSTYGIDMTRADAERTMKTIEQAMARGLN